MLPSGQVLLQDRQLHIDGCFAIDDNPQFNWECNVNFVAGIFAGLATSALFWLLDKQVLMLSPKLQTGGMVVCFIVFGALGFLLARRVGARSHRIVSDTKFKRDLDAQVEGTMIEGGDAVDLLSGNVVRGNAKIIIKNTDIKK